MYIYPARNGSRVSVVWSYDGYLHPVNVAAGTGVLDVLGNPVAVEGDVITADVEPVYFITPVR